MATFQLSKKNKKRSNKNLKLVIGWSLLAISTFIFLFSITRILPFLQYFFLGCFGIFVYPLCLLGIVVSLALLNNKKYVMSKKYAIFLTLSLLLFLSIIQLIILGSPKGLTYSEYIGLNYSKQITAGGIIIGFIPSSLSYLMGQVATYILLSIGLITSVAFFVESVVSLRKTAQQQEPIKLQIREEEREEQENSPKFNPIKKESVLDEKETKQQLNVMFEGNVQQEEKRELTAREKLGLVGGYKQKVSDPYVPKEVILPPVEESKDKIPSNMTMKEYLLSPPTVDLEKFKQQSSRPVRQMPVYNNFQQTTSPISNNSSEITENLNALKNEENIQPCKDINININYENFQFDRGGNLPEVKPEQLTNEAEDIIRSVVMQEKLEREEQLITPEPIIQPEAQPEIIEEIEPIVQNQEIDTKDFINFDDLDDNDDDNVIPQNIEPEEKKEELPAGLNNRFNRDIMRERGDISREFSRERSFNRDNILQRDNENEQPIQKRENVMDEMDRRKRFVSLDEDTNKKPEKIIPYKYNRPSLDLLTTVSDDPASCNADMPLKRIALENALENFGIPAKVQNVVVGPTVTRYEIEMPEGISVKKILSLDADIAYALSANGQIRIEAPIPGRSIVGVEVPNTKVAKVSIKDVLQSKEFTLSPSPLTFALGKDITGNVKVCNLQKMPHLLVAGTTGSGKSVCLNSIITSILYKASPDEVKIILIDPKLVEFQIYEGLPHMVIPRVITEPEKAVNALQWAVDEMERRFKLISQERVRNIGEYNQTENVLQNRVKKMPYLVIIFDEFADFMAIAKNEIEDKIRRLAAKARAAGIHLILATQRPSTDVVTGTLKANLPSRIACKVSSRVDSEVVMGAPGAEKLLGYGDMLYKPSDSAAARLQGCFIDTKETQDIVNYIIENNEEIFDEEAFNAINNPNKPNKSGGGTDNKDDVDPLLPQALKICIDNGVASTTMVQRKLSIGYPRAARIIDQLEERKYIASADGSKQRAVYISIEEYYSIFGDIYD